MIYLDNSATAPIDEEVRDAMLPYLNEEFGNPSSKYYCKATHAKNAVEEAREKVAKLLGANPDEIIFTAGATESTNFIIKGYLDYRKFYGDGKNHVITSLVEHKATLNTCKYLNGELYSNNDPTTSLFGVKKKVDRGYEASFVGVNPDGEISVEEITSAIKENTALVSMIYVNNEIGTISDVESVAEICNKNNIALHSDLTQALGKIEIDVKRMGIDYASCSAHKIYGPKGIGAAFMKSDAYGIVPITAFMHGGEQEFGFRAGTHAVHNIVGFGKAAEIALRDLKKNEAHIKSLDDMLIAGISTIDGSSVETYLSEHELVTKLEYNSDEQRMEQLFAEIERQKDIIKYLSKHHKLSSKDKIIAILVRDNWQIHNILEEAKVRGEFIETHVGGDLYQLIPALDLYKLVIALLNPRDPVNLFNLIDSNYVGIQLDIQGLHGLGTEEQVKRLWIRLKKAYISFKNFSGENYKFDEYIYMYLLVTEDENMTENLSPGGIHFLEDKNMDDVERILTKMVEYGERVSDFYKHIQNEAYIFEDICVDSNSYKTASKKLITNVKEYLLYSMETKSAQYQKVPLNWFIYSVKDKSNNMNILMKDFMTITANLYIYSFLFTLSPSKKSKKNIDHSLYNVLNEDVDIKQIINIVKELRKKQVENVQIPENCRSFDVLSNLYTIMDCFKVKENRFDVTYHNHGGQLYTLEHFIVPDNRNAKIKWLTKDEESIEISFTGQSERKKKLINYLIVEQKLNNDILLDFDVIKKIELISDYYGNATPKHVGIITAHIENMESYKELKKLKNEEDEKEVENIRNCYNSFLDEYFSDNNQRTILNKLLEGLKLTFINS